MGDRRQSRTTQSNHRLPVADNLLERCFAPEQVGDLNRVWCGDITYIPTADGWLYLAIVKDLFSRRTVGWSLGKNLKAGLVRDAFEMAMQTRGFAGLMGANKLFHSDRGSHYASVLLGKSLNFMPSMSCKTNCRDNAVADLGHIEKSF
jgi:transposase InsO family protein